MKWNEATEEFEPEWDFWEQSGLGCAGYSSLIDRDLIRVFVQCDTRNEGSHWYADAAKSLHLDENYVELLKYLLCSADFCEYGTSPRGAWAMHGKEDELREKLVEWYERVWKHKFEPCTATARTIQQSKESQ